MAFKAKSKSTGEKMESTHSARDPPPGDYNSTSTSQSKIDLMSKAIFAPFSHKKASSTRILSDREFHEPFSFRPGHTVSRLTRTTVAPAIMTPRMMNAAATVTSRSRGHINNVISGGSRMDFATLGRAPMRLTLGSHRVTSRDLEIAEAKEELLDAEVPEPEGIASDVSLLRGFNATIPSSERNRTRRRQIRNVDAPRVGLKKLGQSARGMLEEEEDERQSVVSEEDVVVVRPRQWKGKRRARESLSTTKILGKDELTRQTQEIGRDKENLHVRRVRT